MKDLAGKCYLLIDDLEGIHAVVAVMQDVIY
jgi:hypothetical protein